MAAARSTASAEWGGRGDDPDADDGADVPGGDGGGEPTEFVVVDGVVVAVVLVVVVVCSSGGGAGDEAPGATVVTLEDVPVAWPGDACDGATGRAAAATAAKTNASTDTPTAIAVRRR